MSASPKPQRPRIAIFAPDPLLSVTIEARGDADELHLHPAGQGVWVARMAAELGAMPVLCSLVGGETGATLLPLLDALPGAGRITHTAGSSGSYWRSRSHDPDPSIRAKGHPGAGPRQIRQPL
jgi:1-phosphofructokinase